MKRDLVDLRTIAASAAALLLAACASTGPAPVEDRSVGAPRAPHAAERAHAAVPAGGTYRVQRGDTLYSIAFRNGVDYRDLAAWNGIAAPYTIYVGQTLRLGAATPVAAAAPRQSDAAPPAPTATAPAAAPKVIAGAGVPKPGPFENVAAAPPASATPPPPAATPSTSTTASTAAPEAKPSDAAAPASAPPPAATATASAAPPPAHAGASATVGDVAWRWPADGAVIGTFTAGDPTKQGVDIAGKAGDPVRAAADGTVVYSGNGLIGYGELIIIKHSPSFLSAYGHNSKRLVKEGDRVKSGQVIAEMGSSSASRDSLHFEIRRNGKPANPLDYLPRR
ncbi:MAG TPA: peptidoglycan DD-metalloendopeptidase family protein [Dokdonella sp.]